MNMLTKISVRHVLAIGAILILTILLFGHQLYHTSSFITLYLPSNGQEERNSHGASTVLKMDTSATYQVIQSASTPNGAHFRIDFGTRHAINPSIIPHPEDNNIWIVSAQLHEPRQTDKPRIWFAELVCNAGFSYDENSSTQTLRCIDSPLLLPIAATPSDSTKCTGEQAFFAFSIGPHDARVFHGPDGPYAIYGSNSQYTCFGQWMLDFRLLVDWGIDTLNNHRGFFRVPTELQRPSPYLDVEKNWFVFWDARNQSYVHHDIAPARMFARLEPDGSVGVDLAPLAAGTDNTCLQRLLPVLEIPEYESIHQATNTLSVTLCTRKDPSCVPDENNTFVLTIFQHKSFYNLHSTYEPYAMLFKRIAPFEVYGISSKPLWISGRRGPELTDVQDVKLSSEMLYVTSISWKAHGQGYHGFIDDILFIGFGIEDSTTGGIDVVAGDLVSGLGLCADFA